MTRVENLFGKFQIEILVRSDPVRHFAKVLQVCPCDLHLRVLLFCLHEFLYFLIDHFHDVVRHRLTLKLFQKLLQCLLLLVLLIGEVLFQGFINFFQFLLSFDLVAFKVILLLQFLPYLNFVHKVCKNFVHFLQSAAYFLGFIHFLQLMLVHIDEKGVCVDVLGEGDTCEEHIDKLRHFFGVKVSF